MPAGGQYKIVFYGKILQGFEAAAVKKRLAGVLDVDSKKLDLLFGKTPIAIKKDLDYPTASKIKEALRRAGAVCEIERMPGDPGDATPPPAIPRPQPPISDNLRSAAGISAGHAIRPGRIWYVISVLLIILPATAAGIKIAAAIWSRLTSGIEFSAPGRTEVTVDRPAKYTIWFTTDDGRSYHRDIPQDIEIRVYDLHTRRSIEVKPPRWNGRETIANVQRQSIAEVVIERPGVYAIEVEGNFPATELIWRRSLAAEFFTNFVLPILAALLGFGAGLIMAVVVIVRRSKAKYRASPSAMTPREERQWAMFSHLGTFTAFVIPFGNIIAPLIIWQIKKDESAFVVQHSKESLNFQISLMIYCLGSALLVLVLVGILLLIGWMVFNIIAVVIAGIKANDGIYYRYPLAIRFIK